VGEEQRRELRERAEQDDRSVSSVTRAAIDAYLKRERERTAPEWLAALGVGRVLSVLSPVRGSAARLHRSISDTRSPRSRSSACATTMSASPDSSAPRIQASPGHVRAPVRAGEHANELRNQLERGFGHLLSGVNVVSTDTRSGPQLRQVQDVGVAQSAASRSRPQPPGIGGVDGSSPSEGLRKPCNAALFPDRLDLCEVSVEFTAESGTP
jgi:hypothetical protein